MRRIATWVRVLLLALLGTILVPFVVKLGSSYVSHNPERAIGVMGRAIDAISSVAEQSWFYPALFIVGALAAGTWLEWALRRFDGSREAARRSLGYEMTSLARDVIYRQGGSSSNWPQNIADMHPALRSCWIKAKSFRICVPDLEVLARRTRGADVLVQYLQTVGALLVDGHFAHAKEAAAEFRPATRNTRWT